MKAKAALFMGPEKPFEIREYELEAPRPGYALVEMLASGVCGTDVHIYEGRLGVAFTPMVIGHELLGRVCQINGQDGSKGLKPGDRVIVSVAEPCGSCSLCRTGESANCLNLKASYYHDPEVAPHLYGGFAQYAYAKIENMARMPDTLPVKTAAVFPCAGPTVLHAMKCAGLSPERIKTIKTAVVQGLGPVGLFAVLYLRAMGVENIISVTTGRNAKRMEMGEKLGATVFINLNGTTREERVRKVLDMTEGIGADLAVEASGNPQAFPEGLDYLRNRGIYLVPGQYSNSGGIALEPQVITFKALQIFGSSQYTMGDVEDYIRFMTGHPNVWKQVDGVRTHEYRLEDINKAIQAASSGEAVKAILVGPSI